MKGWFLEPQTDSCLAFRLCGGLENQLALRNGLILISLYEKEYRMV